jgi:hypothetical protein
MARLAVRVAAALLIIIFVVWPAVGPVAAATTSVLGGKLRYGDTVVVPATETVNSDL